MYAVLLEFQSTHGHRWRFLNGEWQPGNSAVDAPDQRSVHVHQNSPATGAKWMQENITFTKFKLSNKENGNGKVGVCTPTRLRELMLFILSVKISVIRDVDVNFCNGNLIKSSSSMLVDLYILSPD